MKKQVMNTKVKFTQELKDRWIEHYQNVPHCNGQFKSANSFCALGSLYDVLVKDGVASWMMYDPISRISYCASFNELSKIIPYFTMSKFESDEPLGNIWRKHDSMGWARENEGEIVSQVVELIKQIPVEE